MLVTRKKRLKRLKVPKAPVYYTVPEVATAAGMPLRTVRRWLRKVGALEKRGTTLVTTAERLATEFPEIYRRFLEAEVP